MAPASTQSQSSGSTFTISRDDLINIIANVIRIIGNASYFSSLSALSSMSRSSWFMDFACCNHMTPHSSLFSELKHAPHSLNICTANGFTMSGHNIGSISTSNLSIPGVFNVTDLSYNLFSVGQLAKLGYRIIFDYSWCIVQDPKTRQELGTDPRVGRMFPMDNLRLPLVALISVATAAAVSSIPSLALWHARLGHTSSSRVQQLVFRGLLGSVSTENFDYVSCQLGKQPALPFNTSESISTDIFDLIHSDVWGPSSVSSIGGSQYFVVFVDDYSRYSWIFNMKHRSELLQVYSNFAKWLKLNFPNVSKIFDLIMLLSILNMLSKLFCIPMALFIK